MKLRKKLMLLEDFDAQSNAKVNTEVKAEVKTETKTGEAIRTEVIADVDAILTNLEALSAQMSEGNVTLNESFDDLMKTITSTVNYGKGKSMLSDFKKLTKAANQDLINGEVAKKTEKILKTKMELKARKEKATGPQKEKITKALNIESDKEDKITMYVEKTKAKADDLLAAFNIKFGKVEGAVMGKLKELLAAEKAQIVSDVKQAGLKSKAELLIKQGKDKRAIEAKTELEALEADRKAIEQKIADGKDVASDEIAELKGMQPFMKEIDAFTKARAASKEVEDEITSAVPQYNLGESLEINQTISFLLETEILNLFTAAKGDEDKETAKKNLETAKKLAAAVKKAAGEEWKAKKALHDKVAAAEKVTTKALITLAGGDAEATDKLPDGGYKLGALIDKWGGEEGFISAEEYSPIKKAIEVENGVDQAIEDLEETETAKTSKQLADEFIADNEGFAVVTDKDATVGVTNPETGEEEQKPKYEGAKDFKGKKEDGSDDGQVYMDSLNIAIDKLQFESVEIEDVNEGINPKIKKAIKAVEKGETVYGENVRFPGRFKILSFNKAGNMATVDYEDGTDAFDMAAMNIAIDKLQFEAVEIEETEEVEEGNEFGAARAEAIAKGEKTFKVGDEEYPVEDVSKEDEENAEEFVEEAKEELPKTIKLDEGLTIAQRFSKLM